MKSTVITLLVCIIVIGILNLCANLGVFGGGSGGGSGEYLVLNGAQMDNLGFASIAEEDNLEPDENGQVKLSRDKIANDPRALRVNLLPRSIERVESEGWKFVSVTRDFDYIFRK